MYTNLTSDKSERLPYSVVIREVLVDTNKWVHIMLDQRDGTCRVYIYELSKISLNS